MDMFFKLIDALVTNPDTKEASSSNLPAPTQPSQLAPITQEKPKQSSTYPMPQTSDISRYKSALDSIHTTISNKNDFLNTASALTEGWNKSELMNTFINGSILLEVPLKDHNGHTIISYQLWLIHHKDRPQSNWERYKLKDFWIYHQDPQITSLKGLMDLPLDFDVLTPQILKVFELIVRLDARPHWLAQKMLAAITPIQMKSLSNIQALCVENLRKIAAQ